MDTSEAFTCVKCSNNQSQHDIFQWSCCEHYYCRKCASETIYSSLFKHNSIPTCIYSKCNQLLSIHNRKQNDFVLSILNDNYNNNDSIDYDKNEHLIYGYIKQILYSNNNNNIIFPNEIILLIFDFYRLNCFKQIQCFSCLGTGHGSKSNRTSCQQCHGSGRLFMKCGKCFYYYNDPYYNGTYYSDTTKCVLCNGRGKIDIGKCGKCNTNRNKSICWDCHGKKYSITIDFNKLCNKQLLCLQCNIYYPMNKIKYWTNCYHAYCSQCVEIQCKNKISKYENPICSMKHCNQKLESKWKLSGYSYYKQYIGTNTDHWKHFCERFNVIEWTGCKHAFCKKCIAIDIKQELSKLKMPSCPLTIFHGKHEKQISMNNLKSFEPYFKNIDDFDFKYYLKQLKSVYFHCKICNQRHDNKKEAFLWSNCKHKYERKCIKNYFDGKYIIIENESLFYIENETKKKVICLYNECHQPLAVIDYNTNNLGPINE